MALIELDLDAPPAPAPSRPPLRYFRYVTVFAATILVLALGAAAAPPPIVWQRAGLVPLTGAGVSFQLVGGVLYAIDGNDNRRTTTAWSVHPLRKLWSRSDNLQLDPSGTVIRDPGAALSLVGGDLLQRSGSEVTVLDPATGRIRWSSPVPLLDQAGGTGIVQETDFAPGTEYDQESGDPGQLYFSADGVPHTRPPERTVLRALDLTTGRERWRMVERGSVLVNAAGSARYVVVAADGMSLVDGASGTVVRQHAVPGREVTFPEAVGDLLIVRQFPDQITAFGLDTLEQRWQINEAADDIDVGSCTGLVCRGGTRGTAVLDSRTGAPIWRIGPHLDLVRYGGEVVEQQESDGTPLAVLDSRTGAVRTPLTGWHTLTVTSAATDPLVLFRPEPGTGRSIFGLLRPGARRVVTLGRSQELVRGLCSSDTSTVACRVDDGVEVWRYRA